MKKYLLMAPGPTPLPPQVLLAMAKPIIHHRTDEFKAILKETNEGLQYVFQTANPVVTMSSSGTGAMEAAVVNTLSRGDCALVVRGGKFGERWGELCEAYGVETMMLDVEWGKAVEPSQIESALKKHPEIKAIFTTLCETSTCVRNDIEAIGKIASGHQAVLVVDAISGLCADELKTDAWGVDIVVAGSQKALMLPPGLAFVSVSPKAQELMKKSTLPKFYLSFAKALKSLAKTDTPFTSSVSLIYGLKESLTLLKSEGVDNVVKRHARLAKTTREAARALGLELFSKAPSNVATAILMPAGIDADALRKKLTRDYSITVAGGQDKLKGKIVRVAHLGYCEESDVITVISALEMLLNQFGHKCEPGAGVAAAEKVLLQ
ncbi:alanine--glyoxylate aminotransferase family protein [Candidatus Poribacteria bacterium]|nr:alanine--glyoxylate aminotransferase family protein [Candidatus Poribacteria bacterium]